MLCSLYCNEFKLFWCILFILSDFLIKAAHFFTTLFFLENSLLKVKTIKTPLDASSAVEVENEMNRLLKQSFSQQTFVSQVQSVCQLLKTTLANPLHSSQVCPSSSNSKIEHPQNFANKPSPKTQTALKTLKKPPMKTATAVINRSVENLHIWLITALKHLQTFFWQAIKLSTWAHTSNF